jgi:hypothetical protein
VVAIPDRGIDWRHPDFIPVEYTEAQINAALAGGPALPTRDAVGHGTRAAGIAAGNGRALPSGQYRGMAPEADLIIVKLTSEGAPAHDAEPAEHSFQGCLEEVLDWLDARVTALGPVRGRAHRQRHAMGADRRHLRGEPQDRPGVRPEPSRPRVRGGGRRRGRAAAAVRDRGDAARPELLRAGGPELLLAHVPLQPGAGWPGRLDLAERIFTDGFE